MQQSEIDAIYDRFKALQWWYIIKGGRYLCDSPTT
jgi:hypothetical protein